MNTDEIIDKIRELRHENIKKGFDPDHNSKYNKTELLMAAVALIGVSYSQILSLGKESEAQEFWPFGILEPSKDPKENLIDACQFIVSEIEKL